METSTSARSLNWLPSGGSCSWHAGPYKREPDVPKPRERVRLSPMNRIRSSFPAILIAFLDPTRIHAPVATIRRTWAAAATS